MRMTTLTAAELRDLNQSELDSYFARLDRWKTLQGPWATHRQLADYSMARTVAEVEQRRRGRQARLW